MTESDGVALDCIAHPVEHQSWLKRFLERFAGQTLNEEALEWVADNAPRGVIAVTSRPPLNVKPLP